MTGIIDSLNGKNDLWLERAREFLTELEEVCLVNPKSTPCVLRYQGLSLLGQSLPKSPKTDNCIFESDNPVQVLKCKATLEVPTQSEAKMASIVLRNLSVNRTIKQEPAFGENSFVCAEFGAWDS